MISYTEALQTRANKGVKVSVEVSSIACQNGRFRGVKVDLLTSVWPKLAWFDEEERLVHRLI